MKKFLELTEDLFVRVDAITHVRFMTHGEDEEKERVTIYFDAQTGAGEGGKGGGQAHISSDDSKVVSKVHNFLLSESD